MEIRVTLKGTNAEAEELFENFNVRFMNPLGGGKYEILLRVCEKFKTPDTHSMKKMMLSLTEQGERFSKK